MHNLIATEVAKRDEMIGLWENWAKEHQVAYPKAFNMYNFLNEKKRKEQQEAKDKAA